MVDSAQRINGFAPMAAHASPLSRNVTAKRIVPSLKALRVEKMKKDVTEISCS